MIVRNFGFSQYDITVLSIIYQHEAVSICFTSLVRTTHLDTEENRTKSVVYLKVEDDFEEGHASGHAVNVGADVDGVISRQKDIYRWRQSQFK